MPLRNSQPPAYYPPSANHIEAFPGSAHLYRTASKASTILPQYNSGGQVTPTGSNASLSVLSIQLANPQATYDIGDVIHGTITFSPRKQTAITSITILAHGEEFTTKSGWTSDRSISRSFTICQHNVPVDALPQDGLCYKGFTYTYPFSMIVPDLLPFSEPSCCKEGLPLHYRLPPSMGSPPQYPDSMFDVPYNSARVTYSLSATVKGSPTKSRPSPYIAQFLKYIRVLPSYTPSPNSLSPRSPKAQSTIKRGLLKRATSGSISASVLGIPILALQDFSPAASVPVNITYSGISAGFSVPPKICKVITSILSTTTYSTRNPLASDDTTEDASALQSSSEDSNLNVDIQRIGLFRLDPSSEQVNWTLNSESSFKSYSTILHLPVSISEGKDWLPPTFDSCYISRKYSVEFSISVVGGEMVTVEAPLNLLNSLVARSNMPFDLQPHQYQSPVIAATTTARKNGHHSVVLDSVPGISLDALPQNTSSNNYFNYNSVYIDEQRRLEKTPAFTTR